MVRQILERVTFLQPAQNMQHTALFKQPDLNRWQKKNKKWAQLYKNNNDPSLI